MRKEIEIPVVECLGKTEFEPYIKKGDFIDKSGMFEDYNFKLCVIDAIWNENPSFEEAYQELRAKVRENCDIYDLFAVIKEFAEFFEEVVLTDEDLAKVTYMTFDGGNEIYCQLHPNWDGEDEIFDITSAKGIEKLPNLNCVDAVAMYTDEVLDEITKAGIEVTE